MTDLATTATAGGTGFPLDGRRLRAAKDFTSGTHRVCSPAETLERVRPHFGRIGLTRLADITGLDRVGVPVVLAVRPNSGWLSVDAGKGVSLDAASTSAAMEAFERWHGETVRLPVRVGPWSRVRHELPVVDVDRLPRTRFHLPFAEMVTGWIRGWDVVADAPVWMPESVVHEDPRRRTGSAAVPWQTGSNGLSAGNHVLEAVVGGLYEVVERDAVACWNAADGAGATARRLDLRLPDAPVAADLVARVHAAALVPVVLDVTADTAVPTYLAYVLDPTTDDVPVARGYGTHLDPEVAVCRAVTEALQSRLVMLAGSRDDVFHADSAHLRRGDAGRVTDRYASAVEVGLQDRSPVTGTFEDDLAVLLSRLVAAGFDQVVVVDLSLPDLPLSVVKVFLPGSEGYSFDYSSPGRRALVRAGAHP